MAIKPTLFNFDFNDCTCNCFFNPPVYINHEYEVEKFDAQKSKDFEADYQKSFARLIEKIKSAAPDSICVIDSKGKTTCFDAKPLELRNNKLTFKLIKKINAAFADGKGIVLLTSEGLSCLSDDKVDTSSQTSTKANKADSQVRSELTDEIEEESQDESKKIDSNTTCWPF